MLRHARPSQLRWPVPESRHHPHAHHRARRRSLQRAGEPFGAFLSQAEINQSLRKLYEALAGNRISPRRAATLAYIAYLLLQAHAGLKAEARLTELQGFKNLNMLLKMKYGPPLRKEAEKRMAEGVTQEKR